MSRSSSSFRAWVALLSAAATALVAASGAHAAPAPWQLEADVRTALADAERALILGEPADVDALVGEAASSLGRLSVQLDERSVHAALPRLERAIARNDPALFAAERAALGSAVLGAAYLRVLESIEAGSVAEARRWLLVREFRPPTRFSRPGADATLALDMLASGDGTRQAALAAVRADYLDTTRHSSGAHSRLRTRRSSAASGSASRPRPQSRAATSRS